MSRYEQNQRVMEAIYSNRSLLHTALRQNQKHVPSIKAKVSTLQFMQECRDGRVFAFDNDHIRVLDCTKPPSLMELHKLFESTCEMALSDKNSFLNKPLKMTNGSK